MKTVRVTNILDYYDGVLAFEARDEEGGCYIGSAIKPDQGRDRFMVVRTRPESVRWLRSGKLDLRSILLEAIG